MARGCRNDIAGFRVKNANLYTTRQISSMSFTIRPVMQFLLVIPFVCNISFSWVNRLRQKSFASAYNLFLDSICKCEGGSPLNNESAYLSHIGFAIHIYVQVEDNDIVVFRVYNANIYARKPLRSVSPSTLPSTPLSILIFRVLHTCVFIDVQLAPKSVSSAIRPSLNSICKCEGGAPEQRERLFITHSNLLFVSPAIGPRTPLRLLTLRGLNTFVFINGLCLRQKKFLLLAPRLFLNNVCRCGGEPLNNADSCLLHIWSFYAYKFSGCSNDGCGVRTHALSDWRLKPAP